RTRAGRAKDARPMRAANEFSAPGAEAVLVEDAEQVDAIELGGARGAGDVVVVGLEEALAVGALEVIDQGLLGGLERDRDGELGGDRGERGGWRVGNRIGEGLVAEGGGALDEVAQLADVAGPALRREAGERRLVERDRAAGAELVEEPLDVEPDFLA